MAITDAVRAASARVRRQRAEAAAERHPSKREAFWAGYRLGYTRAWKAWKVRHDRLLRRVGAA